MPEAPEGGQPAAYLAPPPRIPGYRDLVLHRHGSSAEVYRATTEQGGRTVAVKLLRLDGATTYEQFQQELHTAMRLSTRPYVVRILDTGTVEGRPYLAMEFCEDGSYADVVARHGPLSISDAVDVGTKIAEALHGAHQEGLIHRDVTPGNILRSSFGPALADFGIARRPTELSGTVTLNKLTPHHAAPEALRRESQSTASDIYSLGSTLWFLLAGHPPFAQRGESSPDPFGYRERALQRPAPLVPRPDVPVWLQTEVAKALSKQPADRHPSAAAFGEALRRGWEQANGRPWTPPASYPPLGPGGAGAGLAPATQSPGNQPGPAAGTPEDHLPWMNPAQGPLGSPAAVGPPSPTPISPAFVSSPPTPPASYPATAAPDPTAPPGQSGPPSQSGPPGPAVGPAVGSPVAAPPPAPPPTQPAPAPRRRGPTALLVAGLVGVTIGLLVLAAGVLLPRSGPQGSLPQPSAPPETASASIAPDKAPTEVELDDRSTSVVISWRDRTGGTAPHYVIGGPRDASPKPMTQVEKGVSEVTIDGLNPETDYCFTVIAVISVDEVAPADRTCTNRN